MDTLTDSPAELTPSPASGNGTGHNPDSAMALLELCPSEAMKAVTHLVRIIGPQSDIPVLILGETGVGKDVIADAIHEKSERSGRKLVTIYCNNQSRELAVSEIFGHRKGSFTGATQDHAGWLEIANRSTAFFNEIGDLQFEIQSRLLGVLEGKPFNRLGDTTLIEPSFRFIGATNRNLDDCVRCGTFREDLLHRICIFPITVPPLRRRVEDILPLTEYFIRKYSKYPVTLTQEAVIALNKYVWPGNVRELEQTVRRSLILRKNCHLSAKDLHFFGKSSSKELDMRNLNTTATHLADLCLSNGHTIDEAKTIMEKAVLLASLKKNRGKIARVANDLGVSRPTVYEMMERHDIHTVQVSHDE